MIVTANSRKRRPMTPPIKSIGMNAAVRQRVMLRTVTLISFALESGLHGLFAHLHMADVVFQNDDGIVDEKADREGDGEKGEDIDAEAEQIHDCKGAENRHGQSEDGNDGIEGFAEGKIDDGDDEEESDDEREFDIVDLFDDRVGLIVDRFDFEAVGELGFELFDDVS